MYSAVGREGRARDGSRIIAGKKRHNGADIFRLA